MTLLASSALAMPATHAAEGGEEFTPATAEELAAQKGRPSVEKEKNDAESAAAEEAAASATKDVVPPEYRAKYQAGNGTCGDFIATEISAMTREGGTNALAQIKRENNIAEGRWTELNNGMQRMNLANTLRAGFLRGEPITIGGKQHSLEAYLAEFEGTGDDRVPIKLDNEKELGKFIKMMDLQDNDRTRAALQKALGPKPEKKPRKTPEEREAEKQAKAAEAEKARAEKKAKREAEAAERTKAREEAAAAAKKEREEKAAEREKERQAKADERAAETKKREAEKAKKAEEAAAAKAAATKKPEGDKKAK